MCICSLTSPLTISSPPFPTHPACGPGNVAFLPPPPHPPSTDQTPSPPPTIHLTFPCSTIWLGWLWLQPHESSSLLFRMVCNESSNHAVHMVVLLHIILQFCAHFFTSFFTQFLIEISSSTTHCFLNPSSTFAVNLHFNTCLRIHNFQL
jgi:hypothetical protein